MPYRLEACKYHQSHSEANEFDVVFYLRGWHKMKLHKSEKIFLQNIIMKYGST